MKVNFVVFGKDIPETKTLGDINNAEIKFGKCQVATRKTIDIDVGLFLSLVFCGKVLWKYRMYDMNNRRRNVWLIKENDYNQIIKRIENDI